MKAKQYVGEIHEVPIFEVGTSRNLGSVAVTQEQYNDIEAQGTTARRIFPADLLGDANLEKIGMDSGGDWLQHVCFGEYWN